MSIKTRDEHHASQSSKGIPGLGKENFAFLFSTQPTFYPIHNGVST